MRTQPRTQTTENNRPRKETLATGGSGGAAGEKSGRGGELVLAWMLGNNKQKIAASNTQNKRELATA